MPSLIARGLQSLQKEGLAVFLKKASTKVRSRLRAASSGAALSPSVYLPSGEAYQNWILQHEPGPEELARQPAAAQAFAYTPLISILTPVYNPDPHALREMIASVLAQTYANWEICLADGVSDRPGVKEILREFQARDARIHLKELEQNLGISGNSNAALEMARGEFIALLDHDDLLAPHALFEVVNLLNEDREWDLLYSDHDLLSQDGKGRDRPLFKPGWSPEIMLSANYLTHLTVIRASRVKEAGGFDPRMDGAQDWELFMRVSEQTQKIAHIPKILYHWREAGGSTAGDIWSKPYAPPAQLRVIGEHLNRQGLPDARAFFDASGYIRVHWALEQKRKVSIIIPSNGANELLESCIGSILDRTAYPNYEIVVVNNGRRRPEEFAYYRRIETDPRVGVLHYAAGDGEPFNYNSVNNFGARAASGDLLLFLNNDTRVIAPDWLDELVLWAEREEVGIVGAKLLHPDGTIQHAGVVIGLSGFAGHIFAGQPENQWTIFGLAEWYRNYTAVTGACMMMRREVYDRIGGLDEAFLLCGSDVEICLRVQQAGLRVVVNPFAKLIHLEGATRSSEIPAQDFRISYRHYLPALQSGDPYFNPNLSYWQTTPTLRGQDEQQPLQFVLDFLGSQ